MDCLFGWDYQLDNIMNQLVWLKSSLQTEFVMVLKIELMVFFLDLSYKKIYLRYYRKNLLWWKRQTNLIINYRFFSIIINLFLKFDLKHELYNKISSKLFILNNPFNDCFTHPIRKEGDSPTQIVFFSPSPSTPYFLS